ncbi:hypothetical protein CRYUN_Cryun38cG0037900 [Craigia yunnanensis]
MPTKIIAEYAKSGRSFCKKCGKGITTQALRLGLVTRDGRGFDMTKWHHLHCCPEKIDPLDVIKGFDLLKGVDQEALKKLAEGSDNSPKKLRRKKDEVEGKRQEEEEIELEESNSKKIKLSVSNEKAELDIAFSVSEVKDNYKDAALEPKWKAFQTIIFLERDDGLHDSGKIAAFDFDGCLAKTSVKRYGCSTYIHMKLHKSDIYWHWMNDVIFTNESNIDRWKNKRQVAVDSKIGRLNNFIKQVKVPMQVFIACGVGSAGGKADDPFRKPNPGMWHFMEKHFNSGITIDMDQSFYVGDAAGRPDDHSEADIKFAQAIGLRFYVPEDYFST